MLSIQKDLHRSRSGSGFFAKKVCKIVQISPETPCPEIIRRACALLEAGELVGVPTETVYGIAADPAYIEKIYAAKERDRGKPIARLAGSLEQVEALGADFGKDGRALAEKYWPGPLTLVLNTPEGPTGFRVPDHPVPLALAREFGKPLALTSANKSGDQDALNAQEAFQCLKPTASGFRASPSSDDDRFQTLENPIALYLESFQCLKPTASGFRASASAMATADRSPRSGNLFFQCLEKLRSFFPNIGKKKQVATRLPSTVVQCLENETNILREGAVSREQLSQPGSSIGAAEAWRAHSVS